MGLSKTGVSCFDTPRVIGNNLEPDPPARIIPFHFLETSFKKDFLTDKLLYLNSFIIT